MISFNVPACKEDASRQVTSFNNVIHKKYLGWTAATSAWNDACRPVVSPAPPSTPQASFSRVAANAVPIQAQNSTLPRKKERKRGAASAPPMPNESNNKPLYVYSRDNSATIYANECVLSYKSKALAYHLRLSL
jgi:hypothetical protein